PRQPVHSFQHPVGKSGKICNGENCAGDKRDPGDPLSPRHLLTPSLVLGKRTTDSFRTAGPLGGYYPAVLVLLLNVCHPATPAQVTTSVREPQSPRVAGRRGSGRQSVSGGWIDRATQLTVHPARRDAQPIRSIHGVQNRTRMPGRPGGLVDVAAVAH